MFENYKTELLEFYALRKASGLLSENLENPGRQKLQKECLHAFLDKNRPKDELLLRRFFDPSNKYEDLARSIEKFPLDKFRPLVSFLENKTKIREDAPAKLVAWLIGFDTYTEWQKKEKETTNPEKTGGGGEISDGQNTGSTDVVIISDGNSTSGNDPVKPLSMKKVVLISIGILITGSGCFMLWENNLTRTILPNKDQQCMHWTGYKYVPVNCDDNTNAYHLIPINTHTLNDFKKIRYPDTLTKNSLGKVFYSKINGKLEFFTDSGVHPMDALRRVKPLTPYMLHKYVSFDRYILDFLSWSAGIIGMVFLIVLLTALSYRKLKSTYS